MKRWNVLLALVTCLLLAGCGAEPGEEISISGESQGKLQAETPQAEELEVSLAAEDEALEAWQKAYLAFLRERAAQAVWVCDPENPDYDPDVWAEALAAEQIGDYVLYDMDRDGIPELLMTYGITSAGQHTGLYAYRNGEVTLLMDMKSGHGSFCGTSDGNGIFYSWSFMDGWYVERYSINGDDVECVRIAEGIFSPGVEDHSREEAHSDSVDLWFYRPMIALPEPAALTLPVYLYGQTAKTPQDPALAAAARLRIEGTLAGGEQFYAVAADGFGGDVGWTTMGDYLQPGGIADYGDLPMKIMDQVWADLNDDGWQEAVLTVCCEKVDSYVGTKKVVLALDPNRDMVFAYCLNYMQGYDLVDGTFVHQVSGGTPFCLRFDGYECYCDRVTGLPT